MLCFGKGNLPELGGAFVSISLNTLDDHDPGTTAGAVADARVTGVVLRLRAR